MRVWVAEEGIYSSKGIVGIYATAEAAMKAHPIPPGEKAYPHWLGSSEGLKRGEEARWTLDKYGVWTNNLEDSSVIDVTPYEVKE